MAFGDSLRNFYGSAVANIGKKLNLPELGISERISGAPKAKAAAPQQTLGAKTQAYQIPKAAPNPSLRTASAPSYSGGGSYAPTTSGEASYGGGDSGGDGGGGGYDYIGELRKNFGTVRSSLEGLLPTYDSDFSNFKSNTESAIARARDTKGTQDAEDERLYGENLKQLLQTDKDLRQRRQGTFSNLGTLDSSSYRDENIQADQELQNDQQSLVREKDRYRQDREKEFGTFEKEATSKIAQYGNEIARAKSSLQMAIANANMEEASSIQNYISQLQSDAYNINQQRQAMGAQLMTLQAQGVDVVGNLNKLNTSGFSNQFGSNLRNRAASANARYAMPTPAFGSGYINPRTGRSYTDEERRLAGI